MADINLAGGSMQNEAQTDKVNLGIIVMIIVFVLTLAAYGILFFLNRNLTGQITSTQQEFDARYKALLEGNGKVVVDFKNRIDLANKSFTQSRDMAADLSQIEALMVNGVYLDSYKYDDKNKTITLGCVADNYDVVAKQILSLKKSTYFSDVSSDKGSAQISLGEGSQASNKVGFTLVLTLK